MTEGVDHEEDPEITHREDCDAVICRDHHIKIMMTMLSMMIPLNACLRLFEFASHFALNDKEHL